MLLISINGLCEEFLVYVMSLLLPLSINFIFGYIYGNLDEFTYKK